MEGLNLKAQWTMDLSRQRPTSMKEQVNYKVQILAHKIGAVNKP